MRHAMAMAILILVLTTTAVAAPFKSLAFPYRIDLPDGWQVTSKPEVPVALFAHAATEMTVKLAAANKPAPMGDPDVARYKHQDETSIKEKSTSSKPLAVAGPEVVKKPAIHYGFAYKDKSGNVLVTRFVLFSRSVGGAHTWVKVQATCPKAKYQAASKAFDQFLLAFQWVDTAPATVPSVVTAPPPSTAPTTPTQVVKPVDTGSMTKIERTGDTQKNSDYWKSLRRTLPKDEARAWRESFQGDGDQRTGAEREAARQRALGGIFKAGSGDNK